MPIRLMPPSSSTADASPEFEDKFDPHEVNALYHIRSALIGILVAYLQHAMNLHKMTWTFDLWGAHFEYAMRAAP